MPNQFVLIQRNTPQGEVLKILLIEELQCFDQGALVVLTPNLVSVGMQVLHSSLIWNVASTGTSEQCRLTKSALLGEPIPATQPSSRPDSTHDGSELEALREEVKLLRAENSRLKGG